MSFSLKICLFVYTDVFKGNRITIYFCLCNNFAYEICKKVVHCCILRVCCFFQAIVTLFFYIIDLTDKVLLILSTRKLNMLLDFIKGILWPPDLLDFLSLVEEAFQLLLFLDIFPHPSTTWVALFLSKIFIFHCWYNTYIWIKAIFSKFYQHLEC